MNDALTFAVLTISDRCAKGAAQDTSGPALVTAVAEAIGATCIETGLVPDEPDQIEAALRAWIAQANAPELILTTGGTGLSPRDVTPEATAQVIERRHDALLDLARMRCYAITPLTYLSRGVAGVAGRSLIINLPGSPRGACEVFSALADILPHALQTMRGEAKTPDQHRPDAH